MQKQELTNMLLDQSKDLVWVVNSDYQLVYANKNYLSVVKMVTGKEPKVNQSAFVEGLNEDDFEKWNAYYTRGLQGEYFEIEEQHYDSDKNETRYANVTFEPLTENDDKVFAVACHSKDITHIVKQKSEAEQMMNASLDIFCTVDEEGRFTHVSAAAKVLWGYKPEELIGKPFQDLIFEEDVAKTIEVARAIREGRDAKSFINRYKKKEGGIAYNSWSVRWDEHAKLMYGVARDIREKIEQEEKILQSEQRFKALVQEGADLIGILDEEGNYKYVSPTSSTVLGISPEEFIGRNAFDFIHPDDAERTLISLEKIATQSKVKVEPFRFQNHKKEWRWLETILTNMLENPAVRGIVANSRDVTDKIEQEQKIQLSQKRFESLVENSMDCIIIISPEGRTTYVSGSVKKILGYSPSEVMAMDFAELVHPDDLPIAENALIECMSNPGVSMKGYTSRVKHKNGSWRWIEPVITNLLHDPAVNGIVDNFRDITEQVLEQERLKLLESVVTKTSDSVLITEAELFDESGPKIIYVNKAFTNMTGFEAEEVIGKTPQILHGPNSNKEELAKLEEAIRNWEPHETTILNYKKSGEKFWVNFKITPVANEKGWYTHWIAIQRDVTEQKNKELEINLINEISDIFHQSNDNNLATCLSKLCEHISKFGDFDLAEVWLPAIDAKRINRVANYANSKAGKVFSKATKPVASCSVGEGLAGDVWKNKTIKIWEHLEGDWLLNRKTAAQKAGFEAMMGMPLMHNDEVIGVFLLGTVKTKSTLSQYVKLLEKLELTIASELSKKKLEIELAQIFDFTPDLICMAGFDGYFKRVNPAGIALLGYSLEEILSKPISSFLYEEDRAISYDAQMQLTKGENLRNFENRYVTKQGDIIWLSWTSTSSPEQGIIYSVAKNITEEKNLRELNRLVGKLAKIGSWEVDLEKETVFWSDEVHKIYGTDPNSFVPNVEDAINFYRDDFRDLARSSFEKCILTQEPYSIETVIVNSQKKEIWVRTTAKAEYINGVCKRVYGSFQDINDTKQAETRLQSLASNLPGVIFQYIINPDGTDCLKFVTEGSLPVWGFSSEQVIQNNQLVWNRIEAGGELEKVKKSISDSIEFNQKWTSRFNYVMPSGELRKHLGEGSHTFLADGTIVFDSIILDITQEAQNKELLEQITDIARIGSWEMNLINQDGDSIYWSPVLRKIVEVDDSYNPTLTGGIEFHIGESKNRIQKALNLLISDGIEFDEEVLLRTAKGNMRWCRAIGKCETVNGKRTKIYGSYQDVHDRKTAEIAVRESEAKFRTIFEIASLGIAQVNPTNGRIMLANSYYETITGYTADELLKIDFSKLTHPDDREKDWELFNKAAHGEEKYNNEKRYVRKDGSIVWVRIHLAFIRDENGKPIRTVAICEDISERKKAEERLKSATERLRIATSGGNIGIWDWDLLNDHLIWDETMYRIFGVEESEFQGAYQAFEALVHPDDLNDTNEKVQNALKGLSKFKSEFRIVRQDKSIRYISGEAVLLYEDTTGKPYRLIGYNLDITERKKAEQEKIRLQETIENSLNEIYIFDAKTLQFSYVNKGAMLNLGYSEQEMKNLTPLDLKEEYTKSSFNELLAPLLSHEKDKIVFFTNHKRKDKSHYPVEVHLQLVTEGDNKRFLAVILDITERKKAEENILKANERFKKVTEATKDVIWDWDIDNNSFYRSEAIDNFFGKQASKFLNTENFWKDSFHPDDLDKIQSSIEEAIADPLRTRWKQEYRLFNEDGDLLYVIDQGVIIRNLEGKATRMVGAMTNITEQKHMELQLSELNQSLQQYTYELERSNQELEQFAFVASHDLQEPLRMVSSFMDLLKLKYGDQLDEKAHQYIYFATDGAKRMKQIILDLLEYSRATRPTEGKEEVNLNEVLYDFEQLRSKLISEKSGKIKSNKLPTLNTYKAAITQILHCLIDNALKYSKEDTPPIIEIKSIEKEKEWMFSIKDNGIGIEPEFYNKIFIIFQRLHNKDKYTGTGIGLSIAKRHVEFLGGQIWLESVPEEGTVFYFTIPKNK